VVNRKVAWYGNGGQNYTYSGTTKVATKWTKELLEIKKMVENYTQVEFNSCLLNLYANGGQGMGWHSDSEKELGKNTTIASVSFGANREFRFRHKKDKNLKTSVVLESGSLLIMKGETQQNWLHQIPKSGKVLEPRVNLTFRTILGT
jgi:alkylated DNA repair dioxygenase AlkB